MLFRLLEIGPSASETEVNGTPAPHTLPFTSARCEGGEAVEGEVVKVTNGYQSCSVLYTHCLQYTARLVLVLTSDAAHLDSGCVLRVGRSY